MSSFSFKMSMRRVNSFRSVCIQCYRLAESKVRYDSQRENYEKMMENKRKEIEDLEKKCVCVCAHVEHVRLPH